jgi:hypothetical protein
MPREAAAAMADARTVGRFLTNYHTIWQRHFPGLNKRAHWHVLFGARMCGSEGVACRTIHRALYGAYGTDIRTCIERVKDCERDGFIRVVDPSYAPCQASAGCLILPTLRLFEHFDRHCLDTLAELSALCGGGGVQIPCDNTTISEVFAFLTAYDQKWREVSECVARQKGLTPVHLGDAMDHLVTYQYWAIVMLLWGANAFGGERSAAGALVIDEINSRMWDALKLGHLAIKERVDNLIRWGFFAEQTIKKRKAVSLTPLAAEAVGKSLAETKPLLVGLYRRLAGWRRPAIAAEG